jgi:hypothetical protein
MISCQVKLEITKFDINMKYVIEIYSNGLHLLFEIEVGFGVKLTNNLDKFKS